MTDETRPVFSTDDSPGGDQRQSESAETMDSAISPQSGKLIAGRYKLLQPIGEGGMGSVWLAEQSEPVRRKVAIKLIKAGMDSHQVLARFDAERQALAVMDHPNIAKVLDGGLTVLADVMRLIQEVDPPKPSTRVGSSESLPDVARQRSAEPSQLKRSISGDLDWVVMKALEKDRSRRYETASGLAVDIQRHLDDEPVSAGPPSARYRINKFVRRNRMAVVSVATTGLVALAGIVAVLFVQHQANTRLRQANEELNLANERVTKTNADLRVANERVKERFNLATEAIKFFHGEVGDDLVLKADQFKPLRDKLLQGAAEFYGKLETLLENQPDRASREAMGDAYFELGILSAKIGDRPAALNIHQKGLAVRRELDSGSAATIEARANVARSLFEVGALLLSTGKSAEALAHFEEARDLLEKLPGSGEGSNERRGLLGKSYMRIGYVLAGTGKTPEGMLAYQRAIEVLTKLKQENSATPVDLGNLAIVQNFHGILQAQAGQPDEAMQSYRTALTIQQKLVEDNPTVTDFQYRLAGVHNSTVRCRRFVPMIG